MRTEELLDSVAESEDGAGFGCFLIVFGLGFWCLYSVLCLGFRVPGSDFFKSFFWFRVLVFRVSGLGFRV